MSIEAGGANIEVNKARKVAEDLAARFNGNPRGAYVQNSEGLLESELLTVLVAPAAQEAGVSPEEVMSLLDAHVGFGPNDRGIIHRLEIRK